LPAAGGGRRKVALSALQAAPGERERRIVVLRIEDRGRRRTPRGGKRTAEG
jgi:hypothetical protein